MGLYARHVLPKLIDAACAQKPMSELRAYYVPRLRGRVLEIGFGTGHNLKHYASGDAAPESLHALEPAPDIVALASARIAQAPFPVEVLASSAEDIPPRTAPSTPCFALGRCVRFRTSIARSPSCAAF